jgi:hypothetical protein
MRKKVYAFYKSVLTVDQNEQFAQSHLWKASWERAGWDCVMLNQTHLGSPALPALMHKIVAFPYKDQFRFLRWSGLWSAGGGWITDYDVVNLGFTPAMAEEIEKSVDLTVNTGGPAWITYATPGACQEALKTFIETPLVSKKDAEKVLPEAKILGVKKDPFKKIGELVHVTGDDKSDKMREILINHFEPKKDPSPIRK